ncbi:MAG: type III pantothenate kinase [Dehalococcoidia bacterium]|nr:type III pantothenate kinase [Dehalococcoidia bacterium]
MLLAIDIGNTSVKLGIFDGDRLMHTWTLATGIHRTPDEYGTFLLGLMEHQRLLPSSVEDAVLCGVVPPLISVFVDLCQKYLQHKPLVVEAGVKTGIRIQVDNPREVGTDRVVGAVAAHHLYEKPVIIIDFGTAITFDVISLDGDYIGGVICPGMNVALEALFARTAMLPRIELTPPQQVIGKNTVSAMQSGMVLGYTSLIEGMVKRIEGELGSKSLVVATGGYAHQMARGTSAIDVVNPDLVLTGLRLVYERNKRDDT